MHLSFLVCRWRNASSSCNLEDSRSLPTFIHHTRSIYFNLSISFLILRSDYPHIILTIIPLSFFSMDLSLVHLAEVVALTLLQPQRDRWRIHLHGDPRGPELSGDSKPIQGTLRVPAFWDGNHRCFQFPVYLTGTLILKQPIYQSCIQKDRHEKLDDEFRKTSAMFSTNHLRKPTILRFPNFNLFYVYL